MTSDRLCLLTCQNLHRELSACLAGLEAEDVTQRTFATQCLRPEPSWEGLAADLTGVAEGSGTVEVIACIGCVGSDPPPAHLGIRRVHRLEHCCQLFVNDSTARQLWKDGAYLLTPGWLSRWRSSLDRWGFDRESAREFFGECTRRLVLLDTGVDPDSRTQLCEFATYVNLPWEIIPTGLDMMRLRVENITLRWRYEEAQKTLHRASQQVNRQAADYAMSREFEASLTRVDNEADVVDGLLDLLTALLAPERLAYVPFYGEEPGPPQTRPPGDFDATAVTDFRDEFAWTASRRGLRMTIGSRGERLGVLQADEIAFPEYAERYLTPVLTVARVCALAVSSARNLEETKRAEEKVRSLNTELTRRAAELEVLNRELESFAYSVSHDLRAPVRQITGFVSIMAEKLATTPDHEIAGFCRHIQSATQRMTDIIADLLRLSRVTGDRMARETVDLSHLARQIAAALQEADPQRNVTLVVEDIPPAHGDGALLRIVLDNLIGNAWKFSAPRLQATITLGYHPEQSAWFVRDNGVGFDEKRSSQLFVPFQRLHDRDAFPGHGIGLATVQRVIHRHGGRVWATAAPGEGATIYFTLP